MALISTVFLHGPQALRHREPAKLAEIAKNITVKVPLTMDGLKTCKVLSSNGIMVNVTLCFSANQALMAAKAGATFIPPFVGRLDDINQALEDLEKYRVFRPIISFLE